MTHVTTSEILKYTRSQNYGIPCLATANLEMLIGIIRAAEEKQAPVIICYNEQLSPGIDIDLILPVMVRLAEKSIVPVATHLDHGTDFNLVMKSIYYGCSSVMFDGSRLPFDENVEKTKEIVKVAHSLGISVEAELGAVGGSAVETGNNMDFESIYTDISEARIFIEKTGVDLLAISFGNVHGRYSGKPKLDLNIVKNISSITGIPIVMHGASGLDKNIYAEIIKSGISKINFFSEMCRGIYSHIRDLVESSKQEAFCIDTISLAINFWREEAKKLFDLFACAGKAKQYFDPFGFDAKNTSFILDSISNIVYKKIIEYLK